MVENILNRIRLMINVEGREELLQEIIRLVAMPVLLYIKQEAIPTELEWIVVELAIKRYNRIGAEGFTEEKSDNIQNRYEESMINEYISFLDRWIENNTEVVEVKGVRFF
jgi:hypothetical protein